MVAAKESDLDSDTDRGELPGSTGQMHSESQGRRPNSAGSINTGAASSVSMNAHRIAPVGTIEHSSFEPRPRRPNSAGAVVSFEEPGRGATYEL